MHGDRAAVIMTETGEVQTFAELDAPPNRLSRLLGSAGLEPGDDIAVCMEHHPRCLSILLGGVSPPA